MKPNIVVFGYMRSGTSMMMGSLIDGGYEALYSPKAYENLSWSVDDEFYKLNKREVFEFDPAEWKDLHFPQKHPGLALKVRYSQVHRLAPMPDGCHFIQMRRHPEEIRQSVSAWTGREAERWLTIPSEYARRMDWSLSHAQNRRDALSVTVVDYPLEDSIGTFKALVRVGLNIDPVVAAANYDETQYRFRLNELVVGI